MNGNKNGGIVALNIMKKTIKTHNSNLCFNKNSVVKTLRDGITWPKRNYELYKIFCESYDYCVKVTNYIDKHSFEMERLEIKGYVGDMLQHKYINKNIISYNQMQDYNIDRMLVNKIVRTYKKLYVDCLDFSMQHLPLGEYFFHVDTNLGNVIITEDNQVKIIDPDSFHITNTLINPIYTSECQSLLTYAETAL